MGYMLVVRNMPGVDSSTPAAAHSNTVEQHSRTRGRPSPNRPNRHPSPNRPSRHPSPSHRRASHPSRHRANRLPNRRHASHHRASHLHRRASHLLHDHLPHARRRLATELVPRTRLR